MRINGDGVYQAADCEAGWMRVGFLPLSGENLRKLTYSDNRMAVHHEEDDEENDEQD